jgi:NAD(P)-dependent dehydrogenase (short-subunit alcohol dehydrogenase family)
MLKQLIAICEKLLKDYNDTVVILGSRNEERGKNAIEEIQKILGHDTCHNRLHLLIIDTSNKDSITNAVKDFQSLVGSDNTNDDHELYGIINNAAVSAYVFSLFCFI